MVLRKMINPDALISGTGSGLQLPGWRSRQPGAVCRMEKKGRRSLLCRPPGVPSFWRECGLTATIRAGKSYSSLLPAQWSLVLSARNIPFQLVRQRGVTLLFVPPLRAELACRELCAFLREPPLKAKSGAVKSVPLFPVFVALLGLLLWHALRMGWWGGLGHNPEQWLEAGALNAGKLLAGEWFRAVTALTLHADAEHLLGNCIFGGFVLCILALRVGAVNALALSFYAGVAGNLAVAILRSGSVYSSIGASTALFGSMGILCGLSIALRDRRGWQGIFFPLAAGMAWLAFLGTEGVRVDMAAHFTGLGCGALFGLLVPKFCGGADIPAHASVVMLCLASLLLAAAWLAAFI